MHKHQRRKLKIDIHVVKNLSVARGGEPNGGGSNDIPGCAGSVPPYVCATDVRCDQTLGPCDQSAFGPCG